ncbi:MAG TPA: hypothetical protein VK425_11470 [Acidimicrobiales bacterium]|nr:hypothetical protein [Acidimicrobiales bacterium]
MYEVLPVVLMEEGRLASPVGPGTVVVVGGTVVVVVGGTVVVVVGGSGCPATSTRNVLDAFPVILWATSLKRTVIGMLAWLGPMSGWPGYSPLWHPVLGLCEKTTVSPEAETTSSSHVPARFTGAVTSTRPPPHGSARGEAVTDTTTGGSSSEPTAEAPAAGPGTKRPPISTNAARYGPMRPRFAEEPGPTVTSSPVLHF